MVAEVRRITVAEYHRMAEAGILRTDERVELIAGQILQMAAKGSPHSAALIRTDRILRHQLGERALIRLQDPFFIHGRVIAGCKNSDSTHLTP